MSFQKLLTTALFGGLTAFMLGCGGGDGRIEVDGTITWNGQPIEEGYIEVSPVAGPGQVDGADIVDGKFSLRTTAGEKRVSVVARRKIGETAPTERIPTPEPIYFQYLPPQFNDNTTQTLTIPPDVQQVNLDFMGEERSPSAVAQGRAP